MISKTQVMNTLIGKPIVDALIQTLYNQTDDFPGIYEAFQEAMKRLYDVLGADADRDKIGRAHV